MCSVILGLTSAVLLVFVGACDLLTVGLETFETVPRAMIRSSGDNKEAQQSNHCLPMSFTQAWLQGFNQVKPKIRVCQTGSSCGGRTIMECFLTYWRPPCDLSMSLAASRLSRRNRVCALGRSLRGRRA